MIIQAKNPKVEYYQPMNAKQKSKITGLTDFKTLLKIRKRRKKPLSTRVVNVVQVDSDENIVASDTAPIITPDGKVILNKAERKTALLRRKLKEWGSILKIRSLRKPRISKIKRSESISSPEKRHKILSRLKGRWAAKFRG